MHHTYVCPHMDEASYLLENIDDLKKNFPTAYHKPSPNPPLVDELVNLVPSLVNLVGHVIHLVPSSVESVDQVIDLISPLIDPTLPLESEVKVVDPIPPLVDPTPPFKSEDVPRVFLVTMDFSR